MYIRVCCIYPPCPPNQDNCSNIRCYYYSKHFYVIGVYRLLITSSWFKGSDARQNDGSCGTIQMVRYMRDSSMLATLTSYVHICMLMGGLFERPDFGR